MRPACPARWRHAASVGVAPRAAGEADRPLLWQIYASTRAGELAMVPWRDDQKHAFVDMQFRAQDADYARNYPLMERLVLEASDAPVGRLYLDTSGPDHRIVDIALMSEHRGRGFGSALLRDVLDAAECAAKAVAIHVEKSNPARRLYERLGFVLVEDRGIYDLMRWTPNDREKTDQAKIAS